jgi:hypothetical protein
VSTPANGRVVALKPLRKRTKARLAILGADALQRWKFRGDAAASKPNGAAIGNLDLRQPQRWEFRGDAAASKPDGAAIGNLDLRQPQILS